MFFPGKVVRVFAAGTAGYVLGKASYANTCKQKFLEQAPNSNISRMLRGEQPLPPQEQPQQVVLKITSTCFKLLAQEIFLIISLGLHGLHGAWNATAAAATTTFWPAVTASGSAAAGGGN